MGHGCRRQERTCKLASKIITLHSTLTPAKRPLAQVSLYVRCQMDIEELKKEFSDVDWMRAVFNEYTVQAIEWMVDRVIELTEENEALYRDKEFLREKLNKHLTPNAGDKADRGGSKKTAICVGYGDI